MTDVQRLQLRASELRQRLNELGGHDQLTDDDQAEVDRLTAEYRTNEARQRALTVAGDDPADPPADHPVRAVEARAYLQAVAAGRVLDGAERELNDELELGDDWLPLDALEERAVTPAPTDVPRTSGSIAARVFASTAAARLGIQFPTVPAGERVYVAMATGATPGRLAKSAEATAPAGSLTTVKLEPGRTSGALEFQIEDAAALAGLEDAIRADLRGSLAESVDAQVIAGNGTAPNVDGLLEHGTAPTAPATGVETHQRYRTAYLAAVSARYGPPTAVLLGEDTYRQAGAVYRGNSADVDGLAALGGESAIVLSPHVPAVGSHIQQAAFVRTGGRAGAPLGVAPVWRGLQLIRDNVTQARKGIVTITAVQLWAYSVTNANRLVRDSFRVSS